MGTALIPFAYEDQLVRSVLRAGEPWFVAKDVCAALEVGNSRDAIARLDDDEKADVGIADTSSNGTTQERTFSIISEAGLYRLVFTSRKKEAERFKRWLAHEVLPSLRRTGSYALPGADLLARLDRLEARIDQVAAVPRRAVMPAPYSPRFRADREVFDFITAAYGKRTAAKTYRMCVDLFGWERAPSRVTINKYWLQIDRTRPAGAPKRPHAQFRQHLTVIAGDRA